VARPHPDGTHGTPTTWRLSRRAVIRSARESGVRRILYRRSPKKPIRLRRSERDADARPHRRPRATARGRAVDSPSPRARHPASDGQEPLRSVCVDGRVRSRPHPIRHRPRGGRRRELGADDDVDRRRFREGRGRGPRRSWWAAGHAPAHRTRTCSARRATQRGPGRRSRS
jgi:hypothetical protein